MERYISSKKPFDPYEAALAMRTRGYSKSDDVFRISVKINNLSALKDLLEQMKSHNRIKSDRISNVVQFGSEVKTGRNEWIITCQVTEDQYRLIAQQSYVISIQIEQKVGVFSNG